MNQSTRIRRLIYVAAFLICLSFARNVNAQVLPYRFHPGIRISKTKSPTARQLSALMRELSFLSGLDLKLDPDGTVHYDTLHVASGSALARELLIMTIDGADSFSVESFNSSTQVAFAQIEPILDYQNGNQRAVEWVIRIDFADFAELRGDGAVLKAFNPATNMLHELIHAVLNLPDPDGPTDRLGPCERYLNRIRAEVGLPLRQNYFPKNRLTRSPQSLSQILQGELNFTPLDPELEKVKQSSLTFNIARVVDLERVKSNMPILCDLVAVSRRPTTQKR